MTVSVDSVFDVAAIAKDEQSSRADAIESIVFIGFLTLLAAIKHNSGLHRLAHQSIRSDVRVDREIKARTLAYALVEKG